QRELRPRVKLRAAPALEDPTVMRGSPPHRRSMPALLAFVSFAPALDPFGEGTEMRCVLHACVPYVFNGTLARRKKTVLSKLAIKIRVRHDTPHSPNTTRWPLAPGRCNHLRSEQFCS